MEKNLETMYFLFEIKLRQETALKCNPVKQTNKFERMYIRKKFKRHFLITNNKLKKGDVHKIEGMLSFKLFIASLHNLLSQLKFLKFN